MVLLSKVILYELPLLLLVIAIEGNTDPDRAKPSVENSKPSLATTSTNSYLQERLSFSHLDLHHFSDPDGSCRRGLRTLIDRNQCPWEICNISDEEVVWPERCIGRRPNDLGKAALHAADNLEQAFTDESILACYMCCEEKDPTNVWFTLYRSTLPKSLSLMIENAEELSTEEGASSLFRNCLPRCHFDAIQTTVEYVKKQHERCAKAFEVVGLSMLSPSWERFRRAFALVRSRSFALGADLFEENEKDPSQTRLVIPQIGSASVGTRRVLLPLYDLLNHQAGAKARIERRIHPRTRVKSWHVMSDLPCAEGDEICNSYGDERGNFELLLHYGFCCPIRPGDNNHAANRIAFDGKDLLKALVSSHPQLSSLKSRLEKEETERRSKTIQDLALYSVNVSNGKVIPSKRLEETLEMCTKIVATLGIKTDDKADISRKILHAMVQTRLFEIDVCLQRLLAAAGRLNVRQKMQRMEWWREQIHTFLTAEQMVLRDAVSP